MIPSYDAQALINLREDAVTALTDMKVFEAALKQDDDAGETTTKKRLDALDLIRMRDFPPIAHRSAAIIGSVGTSGSIIPATILVSTGSPDSQARMGEICAQTLNLVNPDKYGAGVMLHELRAAFCELLLPPDPPEMAREPGATLLQQSIIKARSVSRDLDGEPDV